MASSTSYILAVVGIIVFALFGGIVLIALHNAGDDHDVILAQCSQCSLQPVLTGLPDTVPPTCQRPIQTTLSDGTTYVDYKDKVDGSLCEDACLKAAAPRTCSQGVCTGVCAGECPSTMVADCPVIKLAVAAGVGTMTQFKLCLSGKCLYFITNPHNGYIEYLAGLIINYGEDTDVINNLLSKACLDLIDDAEPAKKCLKGTFVPMDNVAGPGISSMCLYSYECSRYSLYAGIGNGTFTLASSSNSRGEPILTVDRIVNAVQAASSNTNTAARSRSGFQPISIAPKGK